MDFITDTINLAKYSINNLFRNKEPWQIVTITTSSLIITTWLYEYIFLQDEPLKVRMKKTAFRLIKKIPSLKQKIDNEMTKISTEFNNEVAARLKDQMVFRSLPENGLSEKEIIDVVNNHLELGNYEWKNGRVSGAVYYYDKKLIDLVTKVYGLTSYTNPLHPDIFPGINKMEAEIVRMTANLFNGDANVCGSMTMGGTESIVLACKAYRDYGYEEKGIKRPEIVLPATAHTAFDKAAQYLKIRTRTIPVDPETTKVNLRAMEKAINSNTIMLVGSTPNFPYGTMDDIQSIAKLGVKYKIPVHVDACLGGYVVALAEKLDYPIPQFDFRVPGITSISVDPHKYGFTPKGASVILYSDRKYLHHQFTVTTDWPGGVYGSPTIAGSRAGGIIAACWATLLHFGYNGYLNAIKEILKTSKYIETELRKLDGIFIFGTPVTSVIAIGSKVFDIYLLSDALSKKGWNLNTLQFPSGMHICVTYLHTKPGVADQLLNDIRTELAEILKNPQQPVEGAYAIYGAAQAIPDRSVVGDFIRYFIDSTYYLPDNKTNTNNGITLTKVD